MTSNQPKANKAFIFDMDGVLIDNEPTWDREKAKLLEQLYGRHASQKIGPTRGLNMDALFDHIVARLETPSLTAQKQQFLEVFRQNGDAVYQEAPLTEGLEELCDFLVSKGFALGVVSASPGRWIQMVLDRFPLSKHFQTVISLEDHGSLPHKPEPHGYLEAMNMLGASPQDTFVLEDSNTGIRAAKASGAYTIALRQNFNESYAQTGADTYADHMKDVVDIVSRHLREH